MSKGYCIVFSASRKCYYLLHRGSKLLEALALLGVGQNVETPTPVPMSVPTADLVFQGDFNLNQRPLQLQLFEKVGMSAGGVVSQMRQAGGQNEGVWCLQDKIERVKTANSKKPLIAKLVKVQHQEGERFRRLSSELPGLMHDSMLAFPTYILHCKRAGGKQEYDLIVMPLVEGEIAGDVIGKLWWTNQAAKVMQIIEDIGTCLGNFHQRYGNKQHGDFQTSNIQYDEKTNTISFIDLADIGHTRAAYNDITHFKECLKILSQAYGPTFYEEAQSRFTIGYSKAMA
jgi:hypothetical protein